MDTEQHCYLRDYFDSLEGTIRERKLYAELVSRREVTDLEERPQFTPLIKVIKSKQTGKQKYRVFSENIHTNNPFLRKFKRSLSTDSREIEGEDIPEFYANEWYKVPFNTVPVDAAEVGMIAYVTEKSPAVLKTVEPIDKEETPIYRVIKAQTIDQRLKEIEIQSNFSASIASVASDSNKMEALEVKQDGSHFAVARI